MIAMISLSEGSLSGDEGLLQSHSPSKPLQSPLTPHQPTHNTSSTVKPRPRSEQRTLKAVVVPRTPSLLVPDAIPSPLSIITQEAAPSGEQAGTPDDSNPPPESTPLSLLASKEEANMSHESEAAVDYREREKSAPSNAEKESVEVNQSSQQAIESPPCKAIHPPGQLEE